LDPIGKAVFTFGPESQPKNKILVLWGKLSSLSEVETSFIYRVQLIRCYSSLWLHKGKRSCSRNLACSCLHRMAIKIHTINDPTCYIPLLSVLQNFKCCLHSFSCLWNNQLLETQSPHRKYMCITVITSARRDE
jgi:hypothetical protein